MKTYHGMRMVDGCRVRVIDDVEEELFKGRAYELPLRLDLWKHSPTGFEWGYGGSGPAQLSLALLADATGDDDLAVVYHQPFKWQVVAKLEDGWQLSSEQIMHWVSENFAVRGEEEPAGGDPACRGSRPCPH